MSFASRIVPTGVLLSATAGPSAISRPHAVWPQADPAQRIDLAERLAAGTLRVFNREATNIEGAPAACA